MPTHSLTRPAKLALFLIGALLFALLPIPSRAQSSSGKEVQFPSSNPSCIACQPAFSSPSCKTILDSISLASSGSISNSTLTSCQCSGSFLSLYSSCVKCFTETSQVSLVFGSSQAPAQSSLEAYCKSVPTANAMTVHGGTTKTVTKTTTITSTPTASPSPINPSSAMSLRSGYDSQLGLVFYTVLIVVGLTFSVLP
ncbi:hypothetical protein BGX23_007739 [Mortierella sp. AD031]|nr:hypothetical protein BGX23_007739 [Mortierella sp. AD031]KAG0205189.1 hypothetical protein BGX33_008047 [Mortierella sp. NVP41]